MVDLMRVASQAAGSCPNCGAEEGYGYTIRSAVPISVGEANDSILVGYVCDNCSPEEVLEQRVPNPEHIPYMQLRLKEI